MLKRALFMIGCCSQVLFSLEPIEPAKFDALHALVQPTPEESTWRAIPWGTQLWDARIEAARLGKPIYLWEMDGNPLGCT
ncbi:MAG: hypothetical protein VCG02_04740 [Verrucomicrobiota bacterium]|jgi:DMSO/TMAO reductase YedYZ molybdopterin-dependent catalytic subunit